MERMIYRGICLKTFPREDGAALLTVQNNPVLILMVVRKSCTGNPGPLNNFILPQQEESQNPLICLVKEYKIESLFLGLGFITNNDSHLLRTY